MFTARRRIPYDWEGPSRNPGKQPLVDRLDAMLVLVAVVEAGSRLGMPLATVSRRISELEGHLKTRLVSRSTRQMTLTDAGRSYVEACKRIIEQV